MVTANDDELADVVRMLRAHGARLKHLDRMDGVNPRLDAIHAAILTVKLAHLDRTHIFHQYTIRVLNGRWDGLREHLEEHGIGTMIYYPKPFHLQECFAHLDYSGGASPFRSSES